MPPVVVLCALLGVVVLYTSSGSPEPKTVYVMPERSEDPPLTNTAAMPLTSVPIAQTPGETDKPAAELADNVDAYDECCPEESVDIKAHEPDTHALTDDDILLAYRRHVANGTLPHVHEEDATLMREHETLLAKEAAFYAVNDPLMEKMNRLVAEPLYTLEPTA